MAMGVDKAYRFKLIFGNKGQQSPFFIRAIAARVNDDAIKLIRPDKPSVFTKRIKCY
jgi:hypothetical protein